jgi:uncharacterized Zn finger protein
LGRKALEKISFLVQGSCAEPYKVIFYKGSDKNLYSTCTCDAGKNGQHCKHRISLILGDTENVVSNNISDIDIIASWLSESNIEDAMKRLNAAEEDLEKAKKKVSEAKKNLAHEMRPPTIHF